jgi:hypothetical protein
MRCSVVLTRRRSTLYVCAAPSALTAGALKFTMAGSLGSHKDLACEPRARSHSQVF